MMRLVNKRDRTLSAFGRNVARIRDQQKLSQDDLAEKADLDRTYISGIERGVRNPGIKTVIKLARALEISASGANTDSVPVPGVHDALSNRATNRALVGGAASPTRGACVLPCSSASLQSPPFTNRRPAGKRRQSRDLWDAERT